MSRDTLTRTKRPTTPTDTIPRPGASGLMPRGWSPGGGVRIINPVDGAGTPDTSGLMPRGWSPTGGQEGNGGIAPGWIGESPDATRVSDLASYDRKTGAPWRARVHIARAGTPEDKLRAAEEAGLKGVHMTPNGMAFVKADGKPAFVDESWPVEGGGVLGFSRGDMADAIRPAGRLIGGATMAVPAGRLAGKVATGIGTLARVGTALAQTGNAMAGPAAGSVMGGGFSDGALRLLDQYANGREAPDSRTPKDHLLDMENDAVMGPANEMTGGVFGRALGGVARASGRAASRAATMEGIGVTPTVGQITGNRSVQSMEAAFSGLPGGVGRGGAVGEQQVGVIARNFDDMVRNVAGRRVPTVAETGDAAGGTARRIIEQFTTKERTLTNQIAVELDRALPNGRVTELPALQAYRAELAGRATEAATPAARAEYTAVLREVDGMLTTVQDGGITPGALARERGRAGDLGFSQNTGAAGVSKTTSKEWQNMNAALRQDLNTTVEKAGIKAQTLQGQHDDLVSSWRNSESQWLEGEGAGSTLWGRVADADTPSKAWAALAGDISDNPRRAASMIRQMQPAERATYRARWLQDLATRPSDKGDPGGFSINHFLTQWGKKGITPDVKRAFLSPEQISALDDFVGTMQMVKSGERMLNNSHSGHSLATGAIGASTLAAFIQGGPSAAAGTVATMTGVPFLGMTLLTRPTVTKSVTAIIKGLARGGGRRSMAVATHIGRLTAMAARDENLRDPIYNFLNALPNE